MDDDLTLPGSTLSIGPAQVGWHVASGTRQLHTATLRIHNAGGGTLSWIASSNAPWLTVSTARGRGPATLMLTGDPAGLPTNGGLSAHITLTGKSAGQPNQTVIVPVSLVSGSVYDADPSLVVQAPMLRTNISQVNLQFAAGSIEPRQVGIAVENVGSGTLNWTAVCDWARVKLSTTSGSGPGKLTMTVDPTGLQPGSKREATFTVTANVPGDRPQTITMSVTIEVTEEPTDVPPEPPARIWLPLVSR